MSSTDTEFLTVTQLTTYLKRKFDFDPYLQKIYLTGELSNFRLRPNSHQYFSLKDDHAKINAIMFKSAFQKIKFTPEEGMKVQVVGRISLYEPSGSYQIYVDRMEPLGVGALYQAYEQLKKKLAAEGLFAQNNRPLVKYPRKIAVVTSPSGAVIRDIITTTQRRDPKVQLVLFPAVVQGQAAAASLVQRLEQIYQYADFDTIIIGRGGGSIEDLWPFNEEIVARTMAASPIPIISSVGHETDTTIADLVADVRAATPTAAAELATPKLSEVLLEIKQLRLRVLNGFRGSLKIWQQRLQTQQASFLFQYPERLYQGYSQQLDLLEQRFQNVTQQYVVQQQQDFQRLEQRLLRLSPLNQVQNNQLQVQNLQRRLIRAFQVDLKERQVTIQHAVANLDQLSPLKTLARGYTYASDEQDKPLVKVADFTPEQTFTLHLQDGQIKAQVLKKEQ
ncbi:exodeoxyribonuclease VII large subunit [Lapidilactobacillus dextrinicus]|uniref:exodeoxyribonuclease VII large subunit n=1 Tax=Lapidilactobacillus dextrinicus TaxID=51664 RepID=UPI00070B469C|nr:exodeoxyribonuclease VII large subunit [Lapidilactobacillus dextrinicus]QFG47083.1 exodeoxyribonuclease VII large subunit [Lapidilactobacillus dextrinicus]